MPLDTSTTALVSIFSSFLNSIMNGSKYRSRELLKAIFCYQKTIREQTGSALNFLQPSPQVCWGAYIPYFKINNPIFCYLIFFEECLNPRSGTVDYHHSANISWLFSQTCISHDGCKSFKFMVLRYWEINLWVKLNLFTHAPKQNSPPGSYHHHSRRKKLPISP